MAETFNIHSGPFHAEINPEKLPDMSMSKIRKLFRLMLSNPDENREAIAAFPDYLKNAIVDAKAAWAIASKAFADGWRQVKKKKSRNPEVVKQLHMNNELTAMVKSTKARYDKLIKIQSIYEGETKA